MSCRVVTQRQIMLALGLKLSQRRKVIRES
jgi:hypothetical protein